MLLKNITDGVSVVFGSRTLGGKRQINPGQTIILLKSEEEVALGLVKAHPSRLHLYDDSLRQIVVDGSRATVRDQERLRRTAAFGYDPADRVPESVVAASVAPVKSVDTVVLEGERLRRIAAFGHDPLAGDAPALEMVEEVVAAPVVEEVLEPRVEPDPIVEASEEQAGGVVLGEEVEKPEPAVVAESAVPSKRRKHLSSEEKKRLKAEENKRYREKLKETGAQQ